MTVIDQAEEHPPHHDLSHAIRGHAGIMAVIAEHAAERARELQARREAAGGGDMAGSPAGTGTN